MESNFTDIDELLAKQLAGESTAEEQQHIDAWLAASPDNRRYWENLQWLWQKAPEARPPMPENINTEQALLRVKSMIHRQGGSGRRIPLFGWLGAAAAAITLLAAAVYFFLPGPEAPVQQIASGLNILQDTLADGTTVVLNRQSGIAVSGHFNRRERRLRLDGEAFFEVQRDSSRMFVVEIGELEVQVMGTSFNIDNLSDKKRVTVSVKTGKVQLKSRTQTETLSAGEAAVYDAGSGNISRLNQTDNDLLAKRYRIFDYYDTPLSEVARQLEAAYGVSIVFANPVLETCPLTSSYRNESLERIFELIEDTMPVRVHFENNRYILEGTGCD